MAARFLNRVAGVGSAVGIGGFLVQECIYDGAFVRPAAGSLNLAWRSIQRLTQRGDPHV